MRIASVNPGREHRKSPNRVGGAPKILEGINTLFDPTLIGRNLTEPMTIWNDRQTLSVSIFGTKVRTCDEQQTSIGASSAIDIAVWDIPGKFKGLPICNLLSGAIQSQVKVCEDVSLDDLWVQQFSSNSPSKLRAELKATSSTGACLSVEAFKQHSKDEPRPSVPVAWSEQEWEGKKLCDGMAGGDIDILRPKVILCGGFTALLQIIPSANSHGMLVVPFCSSVYGSGITLVATTQASAAVLWNRVKPEQEINPKEPIIKLSPYSSSCRNEFLVKKIGVSSGYLGVPERPGLGTTVDEQVWSRLTVS
ncbi:Mandelate racemase/muconate lactonizing enzyme, N-terminal [Penicillium italicum]|uniref:Mandelate racemase/muconate lactonizing enzyme, N-terminal n=1 Tax=Penicillium italicum TaxID=40296 RepID=A0A0A2L6G7_PENIT|nr:Mandelate racemase/muconate lactonizing enzyme, N-terminal [Penicillium italicum]